MFDGEEDVRKKEMGAQRSIVFMVVLKKFKQLLIYSLILRYNKSRQTSNRNNRAKCSIMMSGEVLVGTSPEKAAFYGLPEIPAHVPDSYGTGPTHSFSKTSGKAHTFPETAAAKFHLSTSFCFPLQPQL